MANYVKKMYTLPPALIKAVKDFAKSDPAYDYYGSPNESAVARDALILFLSQKSEKANQQPEQTQSA